MYDKISNNQTLPGSRCRQPHHHHSPLCSNRRLFFRKRTVRCYYMNRFLPNPEEALVRVPHQTPPLINQNPSVPPRALVVAAGAVAFEGISGAVGTVRHGNIASALYESVHFVWTFLPHLGYAVAVVESHVRLQSAEQVV
ncbi:hypothetical protein ABFX02_11G077400 [Erythranthe guttata]